MHFYLFVSLGRRVRNINVCGNANRNRNPLRPAVEAVHNTVIKSVLHTTRRNEL